MKKLAYLVSRFPAVSHTFIQREVEELRRQGFQIELFSVNPPDIVANLQTDADRAFLAETFYLKQAPLKSLWQGIWNSFAFAPGRFLTTFFKALGNGFYHLFYFLEATLLGSTLYRNKIAHLHVHFANPAAMVAYYMQHLYGIPYSITVHGPDEFYDTNAQNLAEKFKAAQFLICISYYTQSQIYRLLPPDQWHKVHIVRMGIDPSGYAPSPSPSKKDQPFTITCVGRLSISKGQPLLCQAVQDLLEEGLPLQLVFIGDGPERKWLEKFTNEQILVLGAQNQQGVRDQLEKTNLFVLPSFAEGVPVALMEAMAMEIPCIASGINGIPELIIHEKSGWLVYPSDLAGLKLSLKRLYQDSNLRLTLAKEGRQRIIESYDLGKNTKQLAELLSSEIK